MLLCPSLVQIIPLPDENLILYCLKFLFRCKEISSHCKKLTFIEMMWIFTIISCYSG
jgi:hypothetical protein